MQIVAINGPSSIIHLLNLFLSLLFKNGVVCLIMFLFPPMVNSCYFLYVRIELKSKEDQFFL
jgi:hypothetical protein